MKNIKVASSISVSWLYILLLSLGISACNSCQAQKEPTASDGYSSKVPHPDGTGKVYLKREIAGIMGAGGGGWLERNSRQEEENVTLAIENMALSQQSVVADIGAGTGYYTFRIAPKVPAGRVYAVDVQDAFISALNEQKEALGLSNVEVVKGGSQSPNLSDASLDLAIMVDVYHELEYPQEMLQAIHKALKPDGKLLLLEYRAEDASIPIKELHKMSVSQVNKELNANGFQLYRQEDFLPIQHFLIYEKVGE
ncbi:class I SAM-dependent methyltransferase [Pontibacter diazotrophicus]|uniref:Class I SAM-dependent methyltransferase n=1 Tax=Pontibacter diazotrophicus TaxID=1400979 RepID=A0A3D8LFM1_9BACT|nr:class I SAM-dependent methyltransferase [Pontibacter diazotrophicus]RDV16044.1 class I SAM-dependent methyltransferase [Pontibacter diazotrophicus]